MIQRNTYTLHEAAGPLTSILGAVADFVLKDKDSISKIANGVTDKMNGKKLNQIVSGNIAKSSTALTATFPVIVTEATAVDTAVMISKAVERKAVGMLHMLFAANQITNVQSATDYLKQFHNNISSSLDISGTDIDDILDFSSQYVREGTEPIIARDIIEAIAEDCKRNCFDVPKYDTKSVSINEYSVSDSINGTTVTRIHSFDEAHQTINGGVSRDMRNLRYRLRTTDRGNNREIYDVYADDSNTPIGWFRASETDPRDFGPNTQLYMPGQDERGGSFRVGDRFDFTSYAQDNLADLKSMVDFENKRQIQLDIKKANEAMPSLMVVNFVHENAQGRTINSVCVIGVKAVIHYVHSEDLINRFILKNDDNKGLFNFIRATTREISFFKDFLFAVKRAKVDAVAKSGKGSSNKLWKLLELRANRLKLAKASNLKQAEFAAITSVIISKEEAEVIKRDHRIDIMKPGTLLAIMRGYNLMAAFIVDNVSERVDMLYDDGSKNFETLSFMSLEREESGSMYKKVINLISKGR